MDFTETTEEQTQSVKDEISSLRLLVTTFQEQSMQNLKDRTDSLRLLEDEFFLEDEIRERDMKNLKDEVETLRNLVDIRQEQNNTQIQKLRESCQDFAISSILLVFVYFFVIKL